MSININADALFVSNKITYLVAYLVAPGAKNQLDE